MSTPETAHPGADPSARAALCLAPMEAIVAATKHGAELLRRLKDLPGFGPQKAKIFVALLAKQRGVQPSGWQRAAGDYALNGYRSVADVIDDHSLLKVRETKRAAKAAARL